MDPFTKDAGFIFEVAELTMSMKVRWFVSESDP